MTRVTLAIAPQWFADRLFVSLFFQGLLRRSTQRRDFEVKFVESNDYGALGLVSCEPDSDYSQCHTAVNRLTDAMAFRNAKDPFAELRKLSKEDREDRERVQKIIDNYFDEKNR
jgi:hypothetical protein